MLRLLTIILLAVVPAGARAGLRATYAVEFDRPALIEIADNGDIRADLTSDTQLIVRGGQAFIVEERLTGPIVMRFDDVVALADEKVPEAVRAAPPADFPLVARGTAEISGRSGRAYFTPASPPDLPERRYAVISDDADLAELTPVLRRLFAAQGALMQAEGRVPAPLIQPVDRPLPLLDHGAPLVYGGWTLRSVERGPIAPDSIALPGEPESREALRARLASENREETGDDWRQRMISRAVFAGDRLYLLTDAGALSSLAEGESRRTAHDLAEPVLDICVQDGSPVAITGRRDGGPGWTMRRLRDGAWLADPAVARSNDTLMAMSCTPDGAVLLTTRRLIDLTGARRRDLRLSGERLTALVNTIVHVMPGAVFVGLNSGEWGGGLKRIDRGSGRVETIARNATGDLCDGPLNTNCDPVQGLATIPWRRDCIAAAIGLIHMAAHGRITSVCPQGVEQLVAVADAVDPGNPVRMREAAAGGFGSVAFFGLAAVGADLVAVGHNGLYRIDAAGRAARQAWPRFVEVDGVLLSFALPGLVLVVTEVNRRASVSGGAPMLVVR